MAKTFSLETFLHAVRGVHNSGGGTKETSYYTALNNLLDAVGHTLKPHVRCVMQGGFKGEVQHLLPSKVRRCKVSYPKAINNSSLKTG